MLDEGMKKWGMGKNEEIYECTFLVHSVKRSV